MTLNSLEENANFRCSLVLGSHLLAPVMTVHCHEKFDLFLDSPLQVELQDTFQIN